MNALMNLDEAAAPVLSPLGLAIWSGDFPRQSPFTGGHCPTPCPCAPCLGLGSLPAHCHPVPTVSEENVIGWGEDLALAGMEVRHPSHLDLCTPPSVLPAIVRFDYGLLSFKSVKNLFFFFSLRSKLLVFPGT